MPIDAQLAVLCLYAEPRRQCATGSIVASWSLYQLVVVWVGREQWYQSCQFVSPCALWYFDYFRSKSIDQRTQWAVIG